MRAEHFSALSATLFSFLTCSQVGGPAGHTQEHVLETDLYTGGGPESEAQGQVSLGLRLSQSVSSHLGLENSKEPALDGGGAPSTPS